ncbi:MAG: hypothetical protein ACLQDY_08750 [Streptosporangiaceae bacterium]
MDNQMYSTKTSRRRRDLLNAVAARQQATHRLRQATAGIGAASVLAGGALAFGLPGSAHSSSAASTAGSGSDARHARLTPSAAPARSSGSASSGSSHSSSGSSSSSSGSSSSSSGSSGSGTGSAVSGGS